MASGRLIHMKRTSIWATLLLAMLLGAASVAHAQISVGIVIAPPPPPRAVVVVPAMPAPDHVWVEGYWYPVGITISGMRATGLKHPMKGLTGLRHATMEKGIMPGIGKETAAVWNTITTGTRNMAGTTMIMDITVIMNTTMTSSTY